MQSKYSSLASLVLVVGVHAGVLAAVVMSPSAPAPVEIVQPTIQGILVMAEPEEAPPPPEPPPPPEKKPEPKPKTKPLPKAPPSERAVKAPEPEPPPPAEKPAEPKPIAPAPVTPPNADASELNNPAPAYPKQSRKLGEKGSVFLKILVKEDGTVGEITLVTSSGYKRLDMAAINAIRKWRFIPATQGGKAIEYWYDYEFQFGLNRAKR